MNGLGSLTVYEANVYNWMYLTHFQPSSGLFGSSDSICLSSLSSASIMCHSKSRRKFERERKKSKDIYNEKIIR